ncbi:hypothetical protein [Methanoregula formicica]|uniref:Uncharacterized protein n=1 Tax=Methanoregula formicica (strain DSM 22288 / NBRC 105244 / SMSP) TaxID=593750 RepID=L0HIE2_METFS|nr:hypothetical protein [Methanoregula formicica]AGB03795.1 hypothetical protein Metfor_2812 [Methanoregula formicica SMSP]
MKSAIPILILFLAASCLAFPAAAEVYYSASTPQIITKGDTFVVSGIGAKNSTVALWIIGREYFDVRTVTPDRYGNFSLVYKPTDTMKFQNGQYAVVLQDPGQSRSFEIGPGRDTGGNLTVMNRGKIIFRLGRMEDLPGNVQREAEALASSARLEGVDDIFLVRYFSVEKPSIYFDGIIPASDSRLPDTTTGEKIVISGTTNLRGDDAIHAVISDAGSGTAITTKDIAILPGSSLNRWSYVLEEPGLEPGKYRITLSSAAMGGEKSAMAYVTVKNADGRAPTHQPPVPLPPSEASLPDWLDKLLILGIIFVGAVIVYTLTKE